MRSSGDCHWPRSSAEVACPCEPLRPRYRQPRRLPSAAAPLLPAAPRHDPARPHLLLAPIPAPSGAVCARSRMNRNPNTFNRYSPQRSLHGHIAELWVESRPPRISRWVPTGSPTPRVAAPARCGRTPGAHPIRTRRDLMRRRRRTLSHGRRRNRQQIADHTRNRPRLTQHRTCRQRQPAPRTAIYFAIDATHLVTGMTP